MSELEERIRNAVQAGLSARGKYYESIDLPDEQALGAPASDEQILALEKRIGRPLPASYRAFLQLHDGWQMIDGGTHLLALGDLLKGPIHEEVVAWQQDMRSAGDLVAARSLVIGISEITATKYLLDPERADGYGEWPLIQHHDGEEADLPSFIDWLEESNDEYLELAQMEDEEEPE